MPDTFLDNDVIFKSCVYRVLDNLGDALQRPLEEIGVLASAVFVIMPMLKRRKIDGAADNFFKSVNIVEATEEEIELAATIEEEALRRNLEVDAGESLLAAVVAKRGDRLVTGDKRAIAGLAKLSAHCEPCAVLRGHIITMESTIAALLETVEVDMLRGTVCENPATDLAVSACFMCHQPSCTTDDVLAALLSYQKAISADTAGFVHARLST